jgi:hypothetical protein
MVSTCLCWALLSWYEKQRAVITWQLGNRAPKLRDTFQQVSRWHGIQYDDVAIGKDSNLPGETASEYRTPLDFSRQMLLRLHVVF